MYTKQKQSYLHNSSLFYLDSSKFRFKLEVFS